MVIFRCKNCGFCDINLGMQSHLVSRIECTGGKNIVERDEHGKIIQLPDISKFCEKITDEEYTKILEKLALENDDKDTEPDAEPVELGDGKKYTKNGFEVMEDAQVA